MRWTYSVRNKFLASGILLGLCGLVLFSHFLDRVHTRNVKNAISTLYEDRLIAEVYIFKMTGDIYHIREALAAGADDAYRTSSIKRLQSHFQETIDVYLTTKFTDAELAKTHELQAIMDAFASTPTTDRQAQLDITDQALALLDELSAIQLSESKQIMKRAEELYVTSKTSSRFALAVVIIIILVLQALVFSSKTLVPRQDPRVVRNN
jgi:hypothetical protein